MLWDVLGICRLCAGDLGHSRSVSRRVRSFFFQVELIMSISSDVQEFINTSLAQNNAALLGQISKLVADSAENLKRSSVEAADEQFREIKRLRREEPRSFKRKGNEIQYKFNSKLLDTLEEAKSHLEVNAVEKVKALLSDRQKLILLADKSINSSLVRSDLSRYGFDINHEKSNWEPKNKFSWIGYNIDTHTGFIFASDARIEKLCSDLNAVCANLEQSAFIHVKTIASIVGQIISMTSSCGNVSQIMTRYLHLIINSRHSWNSFVFVQDQGKQELHFWRDNLKTLNGVLF